MKYKPRSRRGWGSVMLRYRNGRRVKYEKKTLGKGKSGEIAIKQKKTEGKISLYELEEGGIKFDMKRRMGLS